VPGFLDTYYPSVAAQEFYLVVLEEDARRFRVWNSAGARELDLELDPSKDINGLFGLYAVFQNEDGPYFMDLASRTSSVGIVNRATDLSLEGLLLDPAPYVDYYNRNSAKFELVCLAPTSGVLDTIALQGGTGRLEDYGSNESLNVKIHSRNVAVCKNMRDAYESYVRGYIKRVQATSNEGELRALGPPLAFHEMSAPVGWTKDRVVDLFNAQFTNDELDAWKAIAQAIDGFNGRKSAGYPFFRFKLCYLKKTPASLAPLSSRLDAALPVGAGISVEAEVAFDVQVLADGVRFVHSEDAAVKLSVERGAETSGVTARYRRPISLSHKRSLLDPSVDTFSLQVDRYAFEINSVGGAKASAQVAPSVWIDSEFNQHNGEMGIGTTFKFEELARKMKQHARRSAPDYIDEELIKWAEHLETLEIQFLVGMVGTQEETILSVISAAPGFFQRRDTNELFDPGIQWNDLNVDEQSSLLLLGWSQDVWNMKYRSETESRIPSSVTRPRRELESHELLAIVHLGFFAYEDYGELYAASAEAYANYAH